MQTQNQLKILGLEWGIVCVVWSVVCSMTRYSTYLCASCRGVVEGCQSGCESQASRRRLGPEELVPPDM
jgi:hypothetical protein